MRVRMYVSRARACDRKCAYARRHGTAYIDEYTDSRTMRSRERIQAYKETHIHAYTITSLQTNTPIQKRIQEYMRACINAYTLLRIHASTRACMHACTHHTCVAHAAHMHCSYPRQCTYALARTDTHASIPHASAYTVRAHTDTRRCPR